MKNSETILKLQDAANQMKLALAHINDDEVFRSCINAYIAAARSVTMVLEKECVSLEMRDWYKTQTSKFGITPLFRFFNDQRVYSIHKGVVKPIKKSHKVISANVWYEVNNKGERTLKTTTEIEADISTSNTGDIINFSDNGTMWGWFFDGSKKHMPEDTGNVPRLCENYYVCLKWLVEEWYREQLRRKKDC